MHHLYAYLAHLLVNRDRYLELPPFEDDGAPGRSYFAAIEQRRIPYRRFRWCDWIEHAGQASLRGLVARHETGHPLYDFAHREADATPIDEERRQREAQLRARLEAFVSPPAARAETGRDTSTVASSPDAPRPGPESRRRSPLQVRGRGALAAMRAPRVAWWVARARRIGLVQKRGEAIELTRFVRRLRPRRVLEIGTARGGSLFLWTRCAADDATLVSVDLPPWEPDDPWEPSVVRKLERLARGRQRLHLLRQDSHSPETRRRVEELFGERRDEGGDEGDNGGVDFLFLDGDHSYDGVARDYAWYAPLVRPGGWIALHDIHPHSLGWGGEVPRFWSEVAKPRRHREIVEDRRQDGFGIGLIEV
jgi:predicted O-methyltransferase YrrM